MPDQTPFLLRGVPVTLAMAGLLGCATPVPAPRPIHTASSPAPMRPQPPAPRPQSALLAPMPYGAAVAARFPEPAVNYRIPALESGRSAFTTQAELEALMRQLAASASHASLMALGRSQAGVPIEALLFTLHRDRSPAAVLASGRPTVLLVGQQHGDEPAGAEALLVIARELASGSLRSVLERINVVVLPRANPDGAEGHQRAAAGGIDVNRDHLLLKTPEAQVQAQLVRRFQPVVVVDLHEYNVIGRYLQKFGAVQRFDALLQYATTANLSGFITRAAEEWFRQPLAASLAEQGLTSDWYYTTSNNPNDRKLSMGGTQPDTARNVHGLKNAVSLLIETRGAGIGRLHLKRRIHTHVTALSSVLRSAAARADDLVKLRTYVDAEVSALACQGQAVIEAGPTPTERTVLMLDPLTGADKPLLVDWDSALVLREIESRPRPCGYWLAADQADAVRRLRALGIAVQQIGEPGVVQGETYRETARQSAVRQDVHGEAADSGGMLRIEVERIPALLDTPPGSYYVPLSQPLANLAIAALEPDTPNSYVSNRIVSGVEREARVMAWPTAKMSAVP